MYDNGNLFLTDKDYKILILSRIYTYNDKTQVKVNNLYTLNKINQQIKLDDKLSIKLNNYLNDLIINKKKSFREILISQNSPIVSFGKDLIIHCLIEMKINYNKKTKDIPNIDSNKLVYLLKENLNKVKIVNQGYIFYKNNQCESYSPIMLNQYKNLQFKKFNNLNLVLDKYYKPNTKENNKITIKKKIDKIDKVKQGINNKIKKLENKIINIDKIIEILENNISNNLLDYSNFKLINENIKDKIYTFKYNDITFDIFYELNVWNNIKFYYQQKKLINIQIQKTNKGYIKAIKNLNEKIKNKKYNKLNISVKEFWFQKFKWFITSDNYLVILGKNMNQNEQIVSKYMTKNDIYVHSDSYGSGSAIIKNIINSNNNKPSFRATREAVSFVVCNSKSWKNKILSNGYWVYPDQVSKTPESGEYVKTGSFIVRGKRNYITPSMVMGFGFIFKQKGEMEIENLSFSGDNLEWAIPICAPFESLKKCKYFVKIVQGSCKSSKCIDNIVSKILKQNGSFLEKNLIFNYNKDLAIKTILNNIFIK